MTLSQTFQQVPDLQKAALIYHGTPITPRAALRSVMPGRAACVSFFRPDDVEAVEAIAPFRHVRQRGVFLLDAGCPIGSRPDRSRQERLERLLRMVGAAPVYARQVGNHSRPASSALPAQRWPAERLALWPFEGRARLAHGRPDRAPPSTMRALRSCLLGMDRRSEEGAGRMPRLPFPDGRGGASAGQPLAGAAHASWDSCCPPLPLRQRGQHQPGAERVAL